jgi:hypothetical protein
MKEKFLKCDRCKEVFAFSEAETERECVGEVFGFPAYEEYISCPKCGHIDLYEVEKCEGCGNIYPSDEMICGVCDNCIKSKTKDIDFCVSIDDKADFKLNSVFAFLMTESEIEQVLMEYLKAHGRTDCTSFIEEFEESYIAEEIAESKKRERAFKEGYSAAINDVIGSLKGIDKQEKK